MTRQELIALESQLNIELAQRQRLGGYSTDAGIITELTRTHLLLVRHLIELDKHIAKSKRSLAVRSKRKK